MMRFLSFMDSQIVIANRCLTSLQGGGEVSTPTFPEHRHILHRVRKFSSAMSMPERDSLRLWLAQSSVSVLAKPLVGGVGSSLAPASARHSRVLRGPREVSLLMIMATTKTLLGGLAALLIGR